MPELKELKELHEDTSQRAAIEVAIESKRIARKKKFEFHEMLWTTPPEGHDLYNDYSYWECQDTVQKHFKEVGGNDL